MDTGNRFYRKPFKLALLLGLFFVFVYLLSGQTQAATGINQQVNFQGRLLTSEGATVPDGYYNIQFKIYQDGNGQTVGNPGGSLEWTESHLNDNGQGVTVKNGFLSVQLGSVNAFGSSVDWDQDTLWLSMNIAGTGEACTPFANCNPDGEMLPMKRLSATPYSLNSALLGGISSAGYVQMAQGLQTDASSNTTIHIDKTGSGDLMALQSGGNDAITIANSGSITFGAATDHAIAVATADADTAGRQLTVEAGAAGSGTGALDGGDLVLQGGAGGGTDGNGGDVLISAGAADGSGLDGVITIGATTTSAINIGTNTSGDTTDVTIGTGAAAGGGNTTLQAKNNIELATDGVVRGTFDTANRLFLGNGVIAASPDDFTVSGTGSNATGINGGDLSVQGGDATTGDAHGGNLHLSGGVGAGTGVDGLVVLGTTSFSTASVQDCSTDCTITQANIDSNGTIIINATENNLAVTLPDPTNMTAGRIIYVSAANGSRDFTLTSNSGGTGNDVSMRQNASATMVWNGDDWTAAGASSSTTLQAAYDNTLTSAGGAELVLNAPGGNADGLTIRNNGTDPITGGILEAQTSIGSSLFSVNNNAEEYATNGGAETSGDTEAAFPANTWGPTTGGTVDRYTTVGESVATGQASVRVQASGADQGARNTMSTSLTAGLTYTVSFAVRDGQNFDTLEVLYSPDGTTSGTTTCTDNRTVTSSIWTRVSCDFIASGSITSGNAILIRQADSATRTFFVDNLSVTIDASATYVADGSVDEALGSNWTAFGTLDGLSRETGVIYDTSSSVSVDTPSSADVGVRNNLVTNPATDTQYLVTFYARSTNTFDDIRVRYSPDGGTSFVSCMDYNTRAVPTDGFVEVTCLLTTDGTSVTDPDLIIDQPTASDRTFYVDALSMTLNTNNSNNVQIGGANKGGPTTLLTLDRSNGEPIAANNDAYLGSMYYDTETGRIQCYESDGWGACGAQPDNIQNLNPEYPGAVLNGDGIGTMTADFCSNDTALSVNTALCSTGEAKNYYAWTSPQATMQTYSVIVSYQLPSTFKGFASDDTVQLIGRVDDTSNADVTYEMFKSTGSQVTKCGSGETDVIAAGGDMPNVWHTSGINGNEATGCNFTEASAGNFIIFKINLKARSNANAYVSTLSFTTTGR